MKRTQIKTVADLLHWEPYLTDAQIEDMKATPCPASIEGIAAPQDLNDITLGQLIQLEQIGAEKGIFAAIAEALFQKNEEWAMNAPAAEMLGLRNMVLTEQQRISQLFAALHREPTAAQVMAGIEKLNFGMFGLADWYARRMGISDHDAAFNTPWLRIWQCRKNDQEEAEYNERHMKVQQQLMKTHR